MYGLRDRIKNFFQKNVAEIETSPQLKKYGIALSLIHFFTFAYWLLNNQIYNDINAQVPAICQPFFQGCTAFRFGTAEVWRWILVTYFFLGIASSILWIKGSLKFAYWSSWFVLLFKFFIYAQDYRLMGNYHYIHFLFAIVFLLAPRKKTILPLLIVLVYLSAGVLKLNWEWVSGSALYGDVGPLKWIPIQLATVYVIILELGFSWLLLSSNARLKKFALIQFFIFHFYSIQIVGLFYPAVMYCVLSILWIKGDRQESNHFWKSAWSFIPHRSLVGLFLASQLYPMFVPGNSALTGEGRLISLNMFDARAQCQHSFLLFHNDRSFEQRNFDMQDFGTRVRCEPYVYLELARRMCEESASTGSVLTADLHLDVRMSSEEKYHTIVDEKDICRKRLTYNPLMRNAWISIEDPKPAKWKTWHYQDAVVNAEKTYMYRMNAQRTGVTEEVLEPLSRPFWRKFSWNDTRHTASKSSPVADESAIYVGSDRGVFAAFNLNGQELWKWQVSSARGIHGSAAVSGNSVFWGDYDGMFYAADKKSGKPFWLIDLGDTVGSSPLFVAGFLYVSVETARPSDGYVVKINALNGQVQWRSDYLGEQAHSSVTASEDSKILFVGSNNGFLTALDEATGKTLWRFKTQGAIKGTPTVAGNAVFVCSWDSHLYAVEVETGVPIWNAPLAGQCQSSGTWSRSLNAVFVSDGAGQTYAFDISTGRQNWVYQGVGNFISSPVLMRGQNPGGERLLAQCAVQALCVFAPKDGKILRRMPLGDRLTSVPWISQGGMVYSLDGPGGIVKWK